MVTALLSALLCGGLEDALGKEISVDFIETPLVEAVEEIRRQSGLPVILEKAELGKIPLTPITFGAAKVTAREALQWATRLSGAAFEVGKKVVSVSSARAIIARRKVLKVYNVGDLAREHPFLPGPEIGIPHELTPQLRGRVGPPSFSAPSIPELIMTRTGRGLWGLEFGSSVEEKGPLVFVTHTPEVHAEIERLLEKVRRNKSLMIAVCIEDLIVPPGAAARAVLESGSLLLTEAATRQLRKTSAASKSANILCFNDQRAHSVEAPIRNFVADFDVSDGVYHPVVKQLSVGLTADGRPTLTGDGKGVLLQLRVTSCGRPEVLSFRPFAAKGPEAPDRPTLLPGAIELPRKRMTSFRTNLLLPFGRTALFCAGDGTKVFLVSADLVRP